MVIWLKNREVSSSSRPVSCVETATKLSLLSTSTCASSVKHQDSLQACLTQLRPAIEKSDAMLYSPEVQDLPDNCINKVLNCYMSELIMIIEEEEVQNGEQDCVIDFREKLRVRLQVDIGSACPPCEIYTLQNITIFLARLKELLQKIKST